MGQKCGVKFRWSCDNCSLLIWKSGASRWKTYLQQRNDPWWGITCISVLINIQTSISGRKKWLTIITEEQSGTLHTTLDDNSTLDLPIFLFWRCSCHGSVNFDLYWFIFEWVNRNITRYGLVRFYEWPNGSVSKLSAFFCTSRYWDPDKVGCQGFAGNQTNANRVIKKKEKYDWNLELSWRFKFRVQTIYKIVLYNKNNEIMQKIITLPCRVCY